MSERIPDWNRYNGLVSRDVVKRSGAELVAMAEQKALEDMTKRRTPTPKQVKDVIVERLRSYQGGAASYLERPTVTVDATGRIHAVVPMPSRLLTSEGLVLPKLTVGMRVRNLETGWSHFGDEGTVTCISTVGFDVLPDTEMGWRYSDIENWLVTAFPCDVGLLQMRAGMRVALAVDRYGTFVDAVDRVVHGTIDDIREQGERAGWAVGHGDDGKRSTLTISPENWLRRAWPILRGDS